MRHSKTWTKFLLLFATLTVAQPLRAGLVHRYSFTETSGTKVKDSAGTADGTLNGGATFGGGKLTLDGNDGYVDLPNGIISALTNATFEAWVMFSGQGGAWQRIFDFGNNSNGEDAQGTGTTFIFLTPRTGTAGGTRFDATPDPNGTPTLDAPQLVSGQPAFVAVTYDFTGKIARLFVDGKLVASGTVGLALKDIQDVNNWLGRSNWPDAFFEGDFDEFRIYDGALTPLQVALDALVGPDQVGGGDPGALQSVTLTADAGLIKGDNGQAVALANFDKVTGVDISSDPDVVFASSPTNVLKVSASGQLTAVGVGTATLTLSYHGKQDIKSVIVSPIPGLEPVLKHRYSFNDAAAGTVAKDSVGTADGALVGGASLNNGSVVLNGTDGYVNLPNGIISALTNATFETWVTWSGTASWERIFDFGSNSAGEDKSGTGQTYLFLTPRNGANNTLRFAATKSSNGAERPILDAKTILPVDVQKHIVVVYDVTEKVGKLYVDGQFAKSAAVSVALKDIKDVNNWLGRSNWPDPYFNGAINEFRIYEGLLSDQQIAFNSAAGPDALALDPGALQSVSVEVPADNPVLGGLLASAAVRASYQNIANVNVTTFETATLQSSAPGVVTVSSNGVLEALSVGTATITGSYQGKTATAKVTVVAPVDGVPKAKLIHRYSFSEAAGTKTVTDSVGTANGDLIGTGTFDGAGLLKFNGTDTYVDLPNGLISSLKNATLETWVTPGSSRNWERIFDIGTNSGGEDQQGTGTSYLFLTPRAASGFVRFALTENSGPNESPVLEGSAALTRGKESHVVVAYNYAAGAARLFVNGQRVAIGAIVSLLAQIDDVNVWLGKSNYRDPFFTGTMNEFRIYDGVLLDAEVAANFANGPDALPGTAPTPPPSLAVSLAGGTVTLPWPANATGFGLESTPALGAAVNWTSVTATPASDNGNLKLTISNPQGTLFYRLKK
ncbi:MAG: LamG domain-containing protein [Verrucomicrobia bacterium]|nr:LamG domain-containing protein [Verrucomicrobiota bacterium]